MTLPPLCAPPGPPNLSEPLVYAPTPGLPAVVHEDAQLLVVNKPPGLLSVPGRLPQHHDSALLRLQAVYGPLWVVHRLDMDTSGLMAFARTGEAAGHLGRQFERRGVNKHYEALVWGRPPSSEGVIALPLRIDWPHRPRQRVDALAGKASVTRYECADRDDDLAVPHRRSQTRLKLKPITGRSHQLRVHLSAIGLPIVGDRFYGWPREAEGPCGQRLMLHATSLVLQHPLDGRTLTLGALPAF